MNKAIHFTGQITIALIAAILMLSILHIISKVFFEVPEFSKGWLSCCAFMFTSSVLPKYKPTI